MKNCGVDKVIFLEINHQSIVENAVFACPQEAHERTCEECFTHASNFNTAANHIGVVAITLLEAFGGNNYDMAPPKAANVLSPLIA